MPERSPQIAPLAVANCVAHERTAGAKSRLNGVRANRRSRLQQDSSSASSRGEKGRTPKYTINESRSGTCDLGAQMTLESATNVEDRGCNGTPQAQTLVEFV